MKKVILVTAFLSGLVGFVAGNAFWYLASPLWIDNVVQETLPNAATAKTIRAGQFRDADFAHKGRGTASILRNADGSKVLRLTEFETTNGPDLKVYLVKAKNIKSASEVTDNQWVSLGRLKGNIGDQNYTLPTNIDPSDYESVVIWCEQFGVLFSAADLS